MTRSLPALALALAMAAGPATAQSPVRAPDLARPSSHAPVIPNPNWLKVPSADDFAQYYPDRAQRMNAGGRVSIECVVQGDGTLASCTVLSEDPQDMGFGDAALKLSRLFHMRSMTEDGKPTAGGRVIVPIRFQVPQD